MLNKLEALYLNILRVVIIVLATVLLVVATIGAVVAGPMLLSSFGGGDADAARLVQKDSLNDYLNRHSGGGRSVRVRTRRSWRIGRAERTAASVRPQSISQAM